MSTNYSTSIPTRVKDLTGQRFGRLLVLRFADLDRRRNSRWLCRCDCRAETTVLGCNLGRRYTKSCGCKRRERVTTHGMHGTSEYNSWVAMVGRCYNLARPCAKYYSGRGITVCKRWGKFENFIADMGLKPTSKHTLERVDNEKGYEPKNCKWATRAEQARNKRSSRLLTFNGKTQCVTEWASEINIDPRTLFARLKRGWPVQKALATKIRR